jgi:hypothetical protein
VQRARHQLLARAGLAAHQHGLVGRRHALDDAEQLLHPRVAGPHAVELHRLAGVAADRRHVDHPADRRARRIVHDRHRAHADLRVAAAGVRDDRLERDAGGQRLGERALGAIAAQERRRRRADRQLGPQRARRGRRREPHVQAAVEHQRRADQLVEDQRRQQAIVGGSGRARHRRSLPRGAGAYGVTTAASCTSTG